MRILIWVQHLLGSGHLSRALTVGSALAGRGCTVTLASGGPPVPWLHARGVQIVQLPPMSTTGVGFEALVDETGRPVDERFWQARRTRLLELFDEFRPDVLMTEMFPFGRRAFRAELLPVLERAGAAPWRPLRVASVRDILVGKPAPERYAWMRDLALAHYDRVLVHTDPRVVPFAATFPFAADLGARVVETGYVAPASCEPAGAAGSGEVLVSAGGGRVGRMLLEVALEARALVTASAAPWRLLAGSQAELEHLSGRARPGIILDRQRPDFRDLLANSLLSVSQAGYNTVVEAMACKKRMVLVPFETAVETEQRTRAERLACLGLATPVFEHELTPAMLAAAVDRALQSPAAALEVDLNGAERTAALLTDLAGAGRTRP